MTTPCYDPASGQILDLEWDAASHSWVFPYDQASYSLAIPLKDDDTEFEASCFIGEPSSAPAFQFAWDHTSLSVLKTCPRKYKWTIIDGWSHKILPPPLSFGIAFHKIKETWAKLLTSGYSPKTALIRCTKLAGLLGESIASGDPGRTKETLVRTTVWYFDQFLNDPAKIITLSDGKPAVELSFTLPFTEIDGTPVYICGHIDSVVQFHGDIYPTDIKTTKYQLDNRFFSKFKPDNQMQLYTLALSILAEEDSAIDSTPSGVIIDGVQLGVNFSRFRRQIIRYSPEEIESFIPSLEAWIHTAKTYADSSFWPANEESCHHYGGCPFRPVCNLAPKFREQELTKHFRKRTWDPLQPR